MNKIFSKIPLLLILGALTGCDGESSRAALSDAEMHRIDVPFREHGYRSLHPMILGSEEDLTALLEQVASQDGWNDKQAFTTTLTTLDVDFAQDNMILFRMTEGSGSIELNPEPPVVNGQTASVEIDRTVPEIGTDDMAYYALLYTIAKDIDRINFIKGSQAYRFVNKPGPKAYPVNCARWFDGCNDCDISADGTASCTEKYCQINDDARCVDWRN